MSGWTGDTLTTYTGDAVTNMDLGAITNLEYFDDIDEPVTLERRDWIAGATVTTIVIHPRAELCPQCDGEGKRFIDGHGQMWGDKLAKAMNLTMTKVCAKCGGDGTHPLAGQVEVL